MALSEKASQISEYFHNWISWFSPGSCLWDPDSKTLLQLKERRDEQGNTNRFGKQYVFCRIHGPEEKTKCILTAQDIADGILDERWQLKGREESRYLAFSLLSSQVQCGQYIQTVASGTLRRIIKINSSENYQELEMMVETGNNIGKIERFPLQRLSNGLRIGIVRLLQERSL